MPSSTSIPYPADEPAAPVVSEPASEAPPPADEPGTVDYVPAEAAPAPAVEPAPADIAPTELTEPAV
jgi:hypothetical protein